MGNVLKKVTLVPLAVAYALDPSIKRLNHLQKDMARGNDVIDDILVDGELARLRLPHFAMQNIYIIINIVDT